MKRCSKCDRSDHRHCKQSGCECPCQYGDYRIEREEMGMDRSQDKFFEDKMKEWKSLNPKIKDKNQEAKDT